MIYSLPIRFVNAIAKGAFLFLVCGRFTHVDVTWSGGVGVGWEPMSVSDS